MLEVNPLAIAVAVVAAFVGSSVWYVAFGGPLARLSPAYAEADSPGVWRMLLELVRSLIVAMVLAGLASLLEVEGLGEALLLGIVLWIGFPVVLLAGSVLHERVPMQLAAIHVGDWLLKLLLISVLVGLWR
jgi:Na+/melibiose symporter-like transporter